MALECALYSEYSHGTHVWRPHSVADPLYIILQYTILVSTYLGIQFNSIRNIYKA